MPHHSRFPLLIIFDRMRPPKKILVLRFSSIGDIVLTSPVIRCLKKTYPQADIHFCTKKEYSGIVENNPYIDRVHLYRGSLRALTKELAQENFDFIVDLHRNLRSFIIKLRLLKPSGTFPKLNFRKYLLVRFKINTLPALHVVDRYFRAIKKLNVQNDGLGLDFFIPEKARIKKEKLPSNFQNGYIAVVLAATYATKQFPIEKVKAVIDQVDCPVVLIGGTKERKAGEEISRNFPEKVWNACGQFTLEESASLIQEARKVLSNDTGMMHIAAALQKEISVTWGNTVPEFGMYPYFGNGPGIENRFEVKGLGCRPCSKLGFDKCPRGHFRCMLDIPEKEVAQSLKD